MQIQFRNDIEKRIFEYISDQFIFENHNITLNSKTALLESRIIDSLGILQVIEFLEREFEIIVEETEMIPENFDSIENMSRFIRNKVEK